MRGEWISYGVLYANGNDFGGFDIHSARRLAEIDERKGYICQVVRYIDGEIDFDWTDDD